MIFSPENIAFVFSTASGLVDHGLTAFQRTVDTALAIAQKQPGFHWGPGGWGVAAAGWKVDHST